MIPPHSTSAVTGLPPSAAGLLRRIAADPSAPCTAAIVGPGGTGKTALLDALVREYQKAGAAVLRGEEASFRLDSLDPRQPVMVDDAHRLDPAVLDVLRELAEQDSARLVVAYRPWPRSAELSALGATLTRRRSPVVVGHLDRTAVTAHIAARLGCPPPDSLVDLVHEQTGGLPWLVDLVTQALRDTGRFDPRHPERFRRPEQVTVSAGLAERLRYQLEELDPEVHRLVQAMAAGAALDTEVLAPLLDTDPAALSGTVQAALATGLLTEAGELIVFIRNLVLQLMPLLHSRMLRQRLAMIQLDRGGSLLTAGQELLGTGASGHRVAAALERAADEALWHSPVLAAELFAGSVQAGAESRKLAARRAQAVALAGDLDHALRLADQVVSDPDAPDRERGIRVVAALLAHRGLAARSAELYAGLLPPPTGAAASGAAGGAALAVPALVGIGELARAQAVLEASEHSLEWGASLLAGAEILMARGILASVTGSANAALSQLVRAAALLEPAGETVLLPDTPAALTAVVAMQSGELVIADSTLRRAVAARLGGRPAHPRHLLLHGWVALANGRLDAARRALAQAARHSDPLEPRDELLAAALEVGLARREDDLAALGAAWRRARCAVLRHPIDLYTLTSLGELVIAGARLGEREWIGTHLRDAESLLDTLGNPTLWTPPLHWSQLHAAIVAGELTEAPRHEAALAAAASSSRYAAALAAAAGCWLAIVSGDIDPEAVRSAAEGLHSVGLSWDAVQLAGQAATRTTDRQATTMLLTCARALHGDRASGPASPVAARDTGSAMNAVPAPPADPASGTGADAGGQPPQAQTILSERELEVGQLILAGLTHKQIGERLFISTKTVEYHMAKIRQRLGVDHRNELFGRLRSLIEAVASAPSTTV